MWPTYAGGQLSDAGFTYASFTVNRTLLQSVFRFSTRGILSLASARDTSFPLIDNRIIQYLRNVLLTAIQNAKRKRFFRFWIQLNNVHCDLSGKVCPPKCWQNRKSRNPAVVQPFFKHKIIVTFTVVYNFGVFFFFFSLFVNFLLSFFWLQQFF